MTGSASLTHFTYARQRGQCLLGVKLRSLSAQLGSPLYPQEQTSPAGPVRSAKGITGHRPPRNQCASLHGGALQVGTDDERTTVVFSQIGNGCVDIEQAEMTEDELSDTCFLRDATDNCGHCM